MSFIQNNRAKFDEVNGKTVVRFVGKTGDNGTDLSFVEANSKRFESNSNGDTAVRVKIGNT